MRNITALAGAVLALSLHSPLTLAAPAAATPTQTETMAPAFSASQINGETFSLSQFRGKKPVLLKFWATWCSYCKEEMPHLNALYEKSSDALEVLTINVGINDSISNVKALFAREGYSLPVIFDSDGRLTRLYGVIGTPTHVLIDKEGQVNMRSHLITDSLESAIDALISQQES